MGSPGDVLIERSFKIYSGTTPIAKPQPAAVDKPLFLKTNPECL
jgi:hypothetical protein